MELPERDVASSWLGLPVEDATGGRVGTCTAVYADDATDRPEWALVQSAFDASLRMVPLIDAHEEGGSLRLSFAADLIDSAPQMGNPDHLTQGEEAELYQHYGVPFSAGPSDSLLPSAAGDEAVGTATSEAVPGSGADEAQGVGTGTMPPLEPEPVPMPEPLIPSPTPEPLVPAPVPQPLQPPPAPEPSRPTPPAPEPSRPSPPPRSPTPPLPSVGSKPPPRPRIPAEGVVAGLAGLSTAVVLLVRERRRSASRRPSARHGIRSAKTALGGAAGVVTGAAEAFGSELARATGQLGGATVDVAHGGVRVVSGAADSARDVARQSRRQAKDVARQSRGQAKDVAVQSRRQVRRSRRAMGRSWRRTVTRATAVAAAGAGYLLGARAGERRYAQIRSAATRFGEQLRG